ncbi:ATP-binding cassette domain-containing protein [Marinobacter sp. W-8]|uniref:ATP-binding cassette domain-containing protein n=1 Tax=Marinobacter sp. W-8 TaxID=3369658 RepID=UPI0037C9BB1D
MPQSLQTIPLLPIEENSRTGLAARKGGSNKTSKRVYELFRMLEEMRDRRVGDLPNGQQQQLAIGRIRVIEPRLLIPDEPGKESAEYRGADWGSCSPPD